MKSMFLAAAILLGAASAMAQENTVTRIPQVGKSPEQTNYAAKEGGFWIAPELSGGVSLRLNHRNMQFGELDVTGGYRFSPLLKVGIGLGARYFINNDNVRYSSIPWTFPIYANVRGNFMGDTYRTCVPYYSLDAGVAVRDGFMIRPTIGVRIGQPRSAFLIGLSYVGQVVKGFDEVATPQGDCKPLKKDRFVSMIGLRLGYEF